MEGVQPGPENPKDHYTGVRVDADGNYISTEHFPK